MGSGGGSRRLSALVRHLSPATTELAARPAAGVTVEPLQITDVKCYIVGTRKNGEQLMVGSGRALIIVKVETSAGHHGWGEAGLLGRELAVEGAVAHFRQLLVGRDARRIGASWQEMYRSQYFEGGRVLTAAISAIDMALHDAVARSLGIPVYMLLGGAQRDRVPCFGTALKDSGGDGMIEEAKQLVEEGFDCIRLVYDGTNDASKIFEPREAIATTAAMCVAARAALGPAVTLGLEWHHRLSVAEAASFCHKLPRGTLDFIEEIIRDETPESYEQLRRMVDVPFAIGEEFASKWQFLPYVERGILEFARLDLGNVGGFTEAMKVAGACEAHYIDMMPHNRESQLLVRVSTERQARPRCTYSTFICGGLTSQLPHTAALSHADVAIVLTPRTCLLACSLWADHDRGEPSLRSSRAKLRLVRGQA